MFRRRDEEENLYDAANTGTVAGNKADSTTSFGNFMENEAPVTAKKEASSTARSIFGVPTVKEAQAEAAKAEVEPAKAAASPLFSRPTTTDNNKVATYKLSAGGALTPASSAANGAKAPTTNTTSTTTALMGTANMDKIETEKRLTVGYGITLEGKISNCDKLIVYGYVHADLTDVKTLHISESGKFSGFAAIENAEISGMFEGDLIVENSIVINPTGKMSGKVTYGSIEIKPGGKFTGQIVDAADVPASERSKKTAKKKSDADNAAQKDFTLSPEPLEEKAEQKEELFA